MAGTLIRYKKQYYREPKLGGYAGLMETRPSSGFIFNPNQVAGLVEWNEARLLVGFNNNDTVQTFTDFSTVGTNAPTQPIAGLRPRYITGVVNGQPVIRYDGADDFQSVSLASSITGPYTRFLVFQFRSIANAQTLLDGASLNAAAVNANVAATNVEVFNGGGAIVSDAISNATFYLLEIVTNGAATKVSINGAADVTGVQVNNIAATTMAVRGDGTTSPGPVDIAAFLLYTGALSAGDRLTIRTGLNRIYNLF